MLLISFVYDKIIVWRGMTEGGREGGREGGKGERETESRLHMRSTLEICIDKAGSTYLVDNRHMHMYLTT